MIKHILLVAMTLLSTSGMSQDLQLETREVLDVIKKWNFAVNARSYETLGQLYGDRVTYYAKDKSGANCIAAKKTLFASNPAFKQKIVTDPTFVAYTSGVVKSTFTREVFVNGQWKRVPTYLLISYEGNDYKIVGESDSETDRRAKRKPAIGEPMEIPAASSSRETITQQIDSIERPIDSSNVAGEDSIATVPTDEEDSTLISSVTEEVLSNETVAVPKRYVYILIGVLALAAFIVVFSRSSKKNRSRKKDKKGTILETTLLRNDKTFEEFVVALFDPHFFTLKTHSRKTVYAGNSRQNDFTPGLEFEFRNKDSQARIAIECIFIPHLASRQILSYSANQIDRYLDFEQETGLEVYLVVGLEGDAFDPKELFLIPATELRVGYLGYQELQPFRKHGMFFYNTTKGRLL
ncbi:MAG TPA: hypothetical protein VGD65_18700 [Chryseosolibacter sp.]